MSTPASLPRVLPRRRGRIQTPLVAMMTIQTLLLIYTSAGTATTSCSLVVTALSLSSVSMQVKKQYAGRGAGTGNSELKQVQWLGTRVSPREQEYEQDADFDDEEVDEGSSQFNAQYNDEAVGQQGPAFQELQRIEKKQTESPFKERQVWQALANLEKDMQLLDTLAGQRPQLSTLEFSLLSAAVLSAATSPLLLGGHVAEFLAPSAAAFTAIIGIGAEYTGKVAVADGKEIAAATMQCSAEAEGFLANAERAKAVTPLCVGIGATSATFALLVPVLMDSMGVASNLQLVTEVYLCCPLISVLAAAVASLALQETRTFAQRAIGVGNRRFARSGLVGRTWLSSTEQVERRSQSYVAKWRSFSWAVLPAPLLGALVPGALPTKTIVVAALAAAQSAFFVAQAESVLSRATDAVALKARSAAVCDTYANQGARSAAILPFTSALSGLCAAATAAVVEFPFLETLAETPTIPSMMAQMAIVSVFPALSALFAAAASVSKARCEVDAEAAMQAASTLALQYEENEDDPVLRPWKGVLDLISLTISSTIKGPFRKFMGRVNLTGRWTTVQKWILRLRRQKPDQEENERNDGGNLTPDAVPA